MTDLGQMLTEHAAKTIFRIVVIVAIVACALGGVFVWAVLR